MSLLHPVKSKSEGEAYNFDKHVHLTYVFPLSNGTEPHGYVVVYDRLNCKNTITFAEVVVTYNPYEKSNCVILGFGDYNAASANTDVTDERETIRYESLFIDAGDSVGYALEEGEHLAELLSQSFMDAYLYMARMFYESDSEDD